MTQRRGVEHRRRTLAEIGKIMDSMKTLALLETHKLWRRLEAQSKLLDILHRAAADFSRHFPIVTDEAHARRHLYVLFGSERGFCGGFNEELRGALADLLRGGGAARPLLLPVGRKLCSRLQDDARVAAFIDGASIAEEIDAMLGRLVDTLAAVQREGGAFSLTVLHHAEQGREVRVTRVLPPFREAPPGLPTYGFAPRLNLDPPVFFAELLDQYLFAVLTGFAYTSMMAENRRRLEHLEGATHRVEQRCGELARTSNRLRQEEITQEIEEIMLGVDAQRGRRIN